MSDQGRTWTQRRYTVPQADSGWVPLPYREAKWIRILASQYVPSAARVGISEQCLCHLWPVVPEGELLPGVPFMNPYSGPCNSVRVWLGIKSIIQSLHSSEKVDEKALPLLPPRKHMLFPGAWCLFASCVALSESQWVPGFLASDLSGREGKFISLQETPHAQELTCLVCWICLLTTKSHMCGTEPDT